MNKSISKNDSEKSNVKIIEKSSKTAQILKNNRPAKTQFDVKFDNGKTLAALRPFSDDVNNLISGSPRLSWSVDDLKEQILNSDKYEDFVHQKIINDHKLNENYKKMFFYQQMWVTHHIHQILLLKKWWWLSSSRFN